jgi:hypothetical protein
MVPTLFFYQLVLIALVWLYLMLNWAWPSAPALSPTTPGPPPGEWPRLCQAASARADGEVVSDIGGAGAVVTSCRRLSHCWASQPPQS